MCASQISTCEAGLRLVVASESLFIIPSESSQIPGDQLGFKSAWSAAPASGCMAQSDSGNSGKGLEKEQSSCQRALRLVIPLQTVGGRTAVGSCISALFPAFIGQSHLGASCEIQPPITCRDAEGNTQTQIEKIFNW